MILGFICTGYLIFIPYDLHEAQKARSQRIYTQQKSRLFLIKLYPPIFL
jgi:hypothetical protein